MRRGRALTALALSLPLALAGGLAIASQARAAEVPAVAPAQAVAAAHASPRSAHWRTLAHALEPSAVVTLGDSYISGEAGRWKGNSPDPAPGHAGTDRAYQDGTTDPTRIYGPTSGTCDRSDVAPILSAHLPFAKAINLACSGARTENVLRAQAGGVAYKGEAPQNDQLAAVAAKYQVRLIDLSIGGNDLGFSPILQSCVAAYLSPSTTPRCSTTQQAVIEQKLPGVQAKVVAVIKDVQATMAQAGYGPDDYRFLLQSYPAPLAQAADLRYPEAGTGRSSIGGCPFLDADADWASKSLIPQLTGLLASAASATGVQFLDLGDAVHGHQLCSDQATQPTGTPKASADEWIRWIDRAGQGTLSESLHPNYFGQQAMGRCLALASLSRRDTACHAVPGLPSWAVYLTRT